MIALEMTSILYAIALSDDDDCFIDNKFWGTSITFSGTKKSAIPCKSSMRVEIYATTSLIITFVETFATPILLDSKATNKAKAERIRTLSPSNPGMKNPPPCSIALLGRR